MTLAHRLRALMRWRGIHSQNQLARISGVPQSSIHRILARGDAYSPSRVTLQRLAAALDTSVPWLVDGINIAAHALPAPAAEAASAGPHPAASDGYGAELQSLMNQLPAGARRQVVAVVRLIVKGAQGPA